jgi:hypothetical protein
MGSTTKSHRSNTAETVAGRRTEIGWSDLVDRFGHPPSKSNRLLERGWRSQNGDHGTRGRSCARHGGPSGSVQAGRKGSEGLRCTTIRRPPTATHQDHPKVFTRTHNPDKTRRALGHSWRLLQALHSADGPIHGWHLAEVRDSDGVRRDVTLSHTHRHCFIFWRSVSISPTSSAGLVPR